MPPSVFSSSEKTLIKSVFPSSSYKIITVSPARIYAAYPTPDRWYYLGVEGALAFVRDAKNTFHFKLVDLASTGTISWDHELYDDFYFYEDKPYFHTFAGDHCMLGLCYADESSAEQMYKKVSNRSKYMKSSSGSSGFGLAKKLTNFMSSSSSDDRKSKSHVSEDTKLEPGLVAQLGNMGVSESDIRNNEGFIRDFLGHGAGNAASAAEGYTGRLPPPITDTLSMRHAPPPPPSAASTSSPAAVPRLPTRNVSSTAVPPPTPPISTRPSLPPAPPARPSAGTSTAPPPPPPPPVGGRIPPAVPSRPSLGGRGPPPPPPTRPSAVVGVPPAPPAPPAPSCATSGVSGLPPPQPGRDALLASIQGKSVKDLKKTDSSVPSPIPTGGSPQSSTNTGTNGGGMDLASALSSALNKRKDNMGRSDGEESDDDW